jgi:hypothetical protein
MRRGADDDTACCEPRDHAERPRRAIATVAMRSRRPQAAHECSPSKESSGGVYWHRSFWAEVSAALVVAIVSWSRSLPANSKRLWTGPATSAPLAGFAVPASVGVSLLA